MTSAADRSAVFAGPPNAIRMFEDEWEASDCLGPPRRHEFLPNNHLPAIAISTGFEALRGDQVLGSPDCEPSGDEEKSPALRFFGEFWRPVEVGGECVRGSVANALYPRLSTRVEGVESALSRPDTTEPVSTAPVPFHFQSNPTSQLLSAVWITFAFLPSGSQTVTRNASADWPGGRGSDLVST